MYSTHPSVVCSSQLPLLLLPLIHNENQCTKCSHSKYSIFWLTCENHFYYNLFTFRSNSQYILIFTICKVHSTSICSMFCTASEAPQCLLRLLVIAASYILPILFIRSCQYFYQAVCAKFSSDLLNSFDQMLSMACNAVQFFCYLKII